MTETTCIRDAAWAVAWDESAGNHRYRRGVDIAFRGDRIVHLGSRFEGPVERQIDGRALMVMPGLVNIHVHSSIMPLMKGIREELGNPRLYMSALYDGWNLFRPEPEDQAAIAAFAYCEMLLSGVTTFVDLCYPFPGWLEGMAESGLRGYAAPLYKAAQWHTEDGHRLDYLWDEAAGRRDFDAAVAIIDQAEGHASGRLRGMVAPMAVDLCTPDQIVDGMAVARDRDLAYQIHAGEAVMEFLEMTRRHGCTQIQWLDELGVLDPRCIVGHAILLDHHSWLHWHSREDVALLARRGCTVAHCPTVFSRYGITLESFGAYRRAGVNMGIGTDTHPHNMIEEMRHAAIHARIAGESMFDLTTADVFDAATVGGANALRADAIGRLAPGMKADLVLVDLEQPAMRPLYDPLRCLVYTAADRAVRDVFVDGRQVVSGHKVLTLDFARVAARVDEIQARVVATLPARDRSGRSAHEVSPLTYAEG